MYGFGVTPMSAPVSALGTRLRRAFGAIVTMLRSSTWMARRAEARADACIKLEMRMHGI